LLCRMPGENWKAPRITKMVAVMTWTATMAELGANPMRLGGLG
jgi:hypothetical protein